LITKIFKSSSKIHYRDEQNRKSNFTLEIDEKILALIEDNSLDLNGVTIIESMEGKKGECFKNLRTFFFQEKDKRKGIDS